MSDVAAEPLSALLRQRRFLILMSLAVIAFYMLGIEPKTDAHVSGLVLTITKPHRLVISLWVVWFWSLWRYSQRVYELRSALYGDFVQGMLTEERRIALGRAKKVGNNLAKKGQIDEEFPKSARIRDGVKIQPPTPEQMQEGLSGDGKPTTHFHDFVPTRSGGRRYPTLSATFDWTAEKNCGSVEETFLMELTRGETQWLRVRAWTYSLLQLPAFSEHMAPFLLAAGAAAVGLVRLYP